MQLQRHPSAFGRWFRAEADSSEQPVPGVGRIPPPAVEARVHGVGVSAGERHRDHLRTRRELHFPALEQAHHRFVRAVQAARLVVVQAENYLDDQVAVALVLPPGAADPVDGFRGTARR